MPKVLVIDDERNLQKLVKVNLLARKYQVLTAPDGERGLEVAQREYPDLVLLLTRNWAESHRLIWKKNYMGPR